MSLLHYILDLGNLGDVIARSGLLALYNPLLMLITLHTIIYSSGRSTFIPTPTDEAVC